MIRRGSCRGTSDRSIADDDHNEPIPVPLSRDRYWLARTANPAPAGGLALIAAWRPSELVFLAQGGPPFLVAYGMAARLLVETGRPQPPT